MTDSSVADALSAQFRAALKMLRDAVDSCPEQLWLDSGRCNPFWHIAYHVAFYTHLYLQESESAFRAWITHQPDSQFLGPRPWAPNEPPARVEPYLREDVLAYIDFCLGEAAERIPADSLEAESGFHWLPFTRLETHLYSLRHLHHHVGQLADQLRNSQSIGMKWVIRG